MKTEIVNAITRTAAGFAVLLALFVIFEPGRASAENGNEFTISESVTAEVSFATPATNIVLSTIGGLTGGDATGTTQVVVTTTTIWDTR